MWWFREIHLVEINKQEKEEIKHKYKRGETVNKREVAGSNLEKISTSIQELEKFLYFRL